MCRERFGNPVEHAGTFPLPESQMDRFMVKASVGYPSREAFKPCTNEMRVAGFAGLETSISIVVDGKNSGTFAFRLASGHRHLCSVFRIIANSGRA